MGFKVYNNSERQRAVRIWMEEGGTASAMSKAIARIRDELGIQLPEQSKSLRNWAKRFKYEPRKPTVPALFGEEQPRVPEIVTRLMPFEEFQEKLQAHCGDEMRADNEILAEIRSEIKSGRIRESIRKMSVDQLYQLRRVIEEGQQKRERHLVTMTEYVDLRKRRGATTDSGNADDEAILAELEETDAVEDPETMRS
jgi:hypothetical protein